MKKRRLAKTHHRALLASLIAVQAPAKAADPAVLPGTLINVDFDSTGGSHGRKPDPVTYDGDLTNPLSAASVAYQDSDTANNDKWNGVTLTAARPVSLFDSAGGATDVTITWTGFTFGYTNWPNNGAEFTNGPNADGFYCNAAEGPGVVTIGGLDPAKTYQVAAIGAGDSVKFAIGDDTRPIEGWNATSNPSNFAIYEDILPNSSGDIVITASSNGFNYGMGGLQITASDTVADTDDDGIPNVYEDANGLNKNDRTDAALDPDNDGLTNLAEYTKGTAISNPDTDGDGLKDGAETGTRIWLDTAHTGTHPLKPDTDGDGLPDGEENFSLPTGTDPNKKDTDEDGYSDSAELTAGFDPRDRSSNPRRVTSVPLINVDFDSTEGSHGRKPNPVTYDGDFTNSLSALSVAIEDSNLAANDQWNGLARDAAQPASLFDSEGGGTDVTVTWTGFTFGYTNWPNNGAEFTNGPNADGFYCGSAAGPGVVTIGGLDPAKTYLVAAIGAGDSVKFTIGDDTRADPGWNAASNPSNFAIYEDIIPNSSGNIVITASSNGQNYGMGGLQITASGTAADSDSDGIPNSYEDAHGLNSNDRADAALDPDNDGLTNLAEYTKGTTNSNPDTDGDGLKDGVESGTGSWLDTAHTGTDPLKADTDNDGLPDGEENFSLPTGTDPNKRDTDGDGYSDAAELTAGFDPRDASSNPRLITSTTLINVDFDSTEGTHGRKPDPVTYDGDFTNSLSAASVGIEDSNRAANDQWNGLTRDAAQPASLFDSEGGVTDVTVTWTGFTFGYTNYPNSGAEFTNGPNADGFYCGSADGPGIVTIGGLDPAKTYHVAAIGAGDSVKFTIGDDTRAAEGWNARSNASNYFIYEDLAPDTNGEIVLTASSNGFNYGMGGLQITASETELPKFALTAYSRDASTGAVTLGWESSVTRSYTIQWSSTLSGWQSVTGQISLPGAAGSMTKTFASPSPGAARLYYRVIAD